MSMKESWPATPTGGSRGLVDVDERVVARHPDVSPARGPERKQGNKGLSPRAPVRSYGSERACGAGGAPLDVADPLRALLHLQNAERVQRLRSHQVDLRGQPDRQSDSHTDSQ
eukprot:845692-Prorocentrum_minimum.AAC.1